MSKLFRKGTSLVKSTQSLVLILNLSFCSLQLIIPNVTFSPSSLLALRNQEDGPRGSKGSSIPAEEAVKVGDLAKAEIIKALRSSQI